MEEEKVSYIICGNLWPGLFPFPILKSKVLCPGKRYSERKEKYVGLVTRLQTTHF